MTTKKCKNCDWERAADAKDYMRDGVPCCYHCGAPVDYDGPLRGYLHIALPDPLEQTAAKKRAAMYHMGKEGVLTGYVHDYWMAWRAKDYVANDEAVAACEGLCGDDFYNKYWEHYNNNKVWE